MIDQEKQNQQSIHHKVVIQHEIKHQATRRCHKLRSRRISKRSRDVMILTLIMSVLWIMVIAFATNSEVFSNDPLAAASSEERQFGDFTPPHIRAISQGVTTREDVEWCQSILSHYKQSEEEWIYGKRGFVSQDNQDWLVYVSVFRHMPRKGVFLDLATYQPKVISNTFFLEKCLGWSGVCFEADPGWVTLIIETRSCHVVDTCVWEEPKEMTFIFNHETGMAGLKGYGAAGNPRNITCTTVQAEMDRLNVKHIDYLSLDIEGAEYQAMKGTDFKKTQIDVITVEVNNGGKSQKVIKK